MLKRKANPGKPRAGWLRSAGALFVAAASAATLVAGCLDRPVVPQKPQTSNVYVAEIRQTAVDKIDLLFMIDNSISMADKQAILGDAVGSLANRLVTPVCVDAMGKPIAGLSANAEGNCTQGSPEFTPIKDIHIGVVSSSLGAHGGQTCSDPVGDDKGQLVPVVRPSPMVTTWNNSGFLFWDPRAKGTPPGTAVVSQLQDNFRNMVISVGQTGCGFESSLEGWYRFLIDPQPIVATPAVTGMGTDTTTKPQYNADPNANPILRQRAAFLRPDSLVAVIMLSDENDCSIVDEGQGWLVGQQTLNGSSFRMPKSTSQCDANPNDACCVSCAATANTPCGKPSDDARCKADGTPYYAPADDALNLRCFKQKQRFGFDLLYPLNRYVDGLYEATIRNRDGEMVANPLYVAAEGKVPRDKSLVFLAGIVGVPWQDIAANVTDAQLNYKVYKDIDWNLILGSPGDDKTAPTPPTDRLMFETIQDRSQIWPNYDHPVIHGQGVLAPSTATGRPNAINGHEVDIKGKDDLQYACIFQLPQERPDCTGAGCDCDQAGQDYKRPLCNGSTQTHAKAYPGVRELQVLKDFGAKGTQNSIVASICPKTLTKSDPSYGYNPAVSAIIDRLKEALKGKCLPRQLIPDPENDNKVPCAVIEATPPGTDCNCDAGAGRAPASEGIRPAVFKELSDNDTCGNKAGQTPCEQFCLCEIQQYSGNDLHTCQTAPQTPGNITPGYCYVDPSTAMGADQQAQETIVASCPATQKRLLRFAGDNTPAKGAIAMIACLGATVQQQGQ